MTMRRWGATLALSLLIAAPALPDEVRLANGDRYTGRMQGMSDACCVFEVPFGATLRIPWAQVVGLQTSSSVWVELRSGERLVGTLSTAEDGSLHVVSRHLGSVGVRFDEVESIPVATLRCEPPEAEVRGRGTGPVKGQPEPIADPPKAPVGEKPPEEETSKTFLRESAVLLSPGKAELDLSLTYSRSQSPTVQLASDGLGGIVTLVQNVRHRELTFDPALRVGLFERAEGEINVPVSWADRETVTIPGIASDSSDDFGIGDVGARLKYLLKAEDQSWPDVIASVGVTAPSGEDPYGSDQVGLGGGHWVASGGITVIKSFDPLSVFAGVEYAHFFEHHHHGHQFEPGESVMYNLGVAFAVNKSITLSSEFVGGVQSEFEVDGNHIPGSLTEPMSLRMGLTHQLSRDSYWEPSVRFGLNEDATDTVLGLAWVKKF